MPIKGGKSIARNNRPNAFYRSFISLPQKMRERNVNISLQNVFMHFVPLNVLCLSLLTNLPSHYRGRVKLLGFSEDKVTLSSILLLTVLINLSGSLRRWRCLMKEVNGIGSRLILFGSLYHRWSLINSFLVITAIFSPLLRTSNLFWKYILHGFFVFQWNPSPLC